MNANDETECCECGEKGRYTGRLVLEMLDTMKGIFRCTNGHEFPVRRWRLVQAQTGAALVEYLLLMALIAIVIITAVTALL